MNIISTCNLTKSYKRYEKEEGLKGSFKSLFSRKFILKEAVKDFNVEIRKGEFIGLIGPNGAGKTTLVKMLTGIIAPTSGEISVLGYYPNKLQNNYKKQYAVVMGQKSQLFFELTPADTFKLFKELYNISDTVYKNNIEYFIELFNVKDLLNVQVRTLSLGERMKMELIVALLHNPTVLFLDEPTIGLDAIAQKQIRKFLKEVNKEKDTTIILTSHYMDDIKSLCNRCIVINEGTKIYDGELISLFDKYQTHKKITVFFEAENEIDIPFDLKLIESNAFKVSFMVKKSDTNRVLKYIIENYKIADISIEEDDIGNVVERIYQGQAGILL